jgi:hypothetical protein
MPRLVPIFDIVRYRILDLVHRIPDITLNAAKAGCSAALKASVAQSVRTRMHFITDVSRGNRTVQRIRRVSRR